MKEFLTPSDIRLRYRDTGAGEDALLLVHGWCSSSRAWELTTRSQRAKVRVVRVDLRGHGASEAPPRGRYRWRDFTDDIDALMQTLGLARVVAIGHSMGSPIALELARRRPETVVGIVTIDGLSGLGLTRERAAMHPWVVALTPTSTAEIRRRLVQNFLPANERAALIVESDAMRTDPRAALAAYRDAVVTGTPRRDWSRLKQPVLYVAASHSRRTATDVRTVIPHAQFGQVVGSGHYVQFDATAQLHAMLNRFLAKLP